jgi:hypothetical protein
VFLGRGPPWPFTVQKVSLGVVHVMAHVEKNVFHNKDEVNVTLAIVLVAIDELELDDLFLAARAVLHRILESKSDQACSNTVAAGASAGVVPMEDVQAGSTGSQPIESPRVLDHVGDVQKTWFYEEDRGNIDHQMLDQHWIELLNAVDGNPQRSSNKFTLTRKFGETSWFCYEYEVDIDAMTSTNKESKKARALHRMEFRVLGVMEMLAAGSTAPFSELTNDGWTMRWQVGEFSGWKNVTDASNQNLLKAFTAHNVLDEFQSLMQLPLCLYEILRGSHLGDVERPLRLVAVRERYNS